MSETEYSKPPTGRRNRGAKIFYQDSDFFEKVNNEKPNSRLSTNYNDSNASPVFQTHRSVNEKNFQSNTSPSPPLSQAPQLPPPAVKPRTKIYESTKLNVPNEICNSSSSSSDNTILNGIFTYENKSIDLELNKNDIKWKYISDKRKKSEFKFDLDQFFSVEPKLEVFRSRSRSRNFENSNQLNNDDLVNGFILFYFNREKFNIYRPKKLIFEHPHSQTCHDWINKLKELMPVLKNHRQVLVLLNPYSGERKTRSIFNSFLNPLFKTARIKYKIIEFHDNLNLKDNLLKNNICFSDYYG